MRPGASLPAVLSWRTREDSEVGREPGGRGLLSKAGPSLLLDRQKGRLPERWTHLSFAVPLRIS